MAKVDAHLELKNVIVGVYKYQLFQLSEFCKAEGVSRSEVIRNAIDLWMRAKALQEGKKMNKVECAGCGEEFDAAELEEGICSDCAVEDMEADPSEDRDD